MFYVGSSLRLPGVTRSMNVVQREPMCPVFIAVVGAFGLEACMGMCSGATRRRGTTEPYHRAAGAPCSVIVVLSFPCIVSCVVCRCAPSGAEGLQGKHVDVVHVKVFSGTAG